MRILSLNAWGGAMFEELAVWLPHADPDVLCVQEVTRTQSASGWTEFTDGERVLPQRADFFSDLCGLLPGHAGRFAASDVGPVTAVGGAHRQEFGIAVFVRRAMTTPLHNSRHVHGVLEATWAEVIAKGYAGLTVEGIASRAGVGKQTLYRWWPSKAGVLLEAVNSRSRQTSQFPDTGDLLVDLGDQLAGVAEFLATEGGAVQRALLAAAQSDPEPSAA